MARRKRPPRGRSDGEQVPEPGLSRYDESWLAGVKLGHSLAAGWRPAPQAVTIALAPGEGVAAQDSLWVRQYTATDVSYNSGWLFVAGGPVLAAASIVGSLLYNDNQRRQALASAAPQWRHIGSGHGWITSHRVAIMLPTGWIDIHHLELRAIICDSDGVILMRDGRPPLKIVIWPPHWYYVLLRFLAFGEITHLDVPEHLAPHLGSPAPGPPALGPAAVDDADSPSG
jgi:hypothetical protein